MSIGFWISLTDWRLEIGTNEDPEYHNGGGYIWIGPLYLGFTTR